MADVLDARVVLAFSSDWPCFWPPNPFLSIQEAVTREIWHSDDTANVIDLPLDGAWQAGARRTGKFYTPEQRVSARGAIDAYTRAAAYSEFAEKDLGTLETGKLADLAVLSQDVFSVPPSRIGATQVVLTLLGGRVVFEAAH